MERMLKNTWKDLLAEEFDKEYYLNLKKFLEKEYREETVYPDKEDIFKALNYTDYADTKVLILGQDPYHGQGQAHGFAFSVKEDIKIPPSLLNIYKELKNDLGYEMANHGSLEAWADQGVLLLNTALTVREAEANSHRDKGWEILTDRIIEILSQREDPLVFILWGANARSKKKLIDQSKHYIVESVHPSPLSAYRGFFGSKPFSKTNDYLVKVGKKAIDWKINNI